MTTNVCNRGIVHLAHRPGGEPFCKARRGHMSFTPAAAEAQGYPVCKRCAAKLAKMQAAAAKREAETLPVAVVDEESGGDRIQVVKRFATVKEAEDFVANLPDKQKVERGGYGIDAPEGLRNPRRPPNWQDKVLRETAGTRLGAIIRAACKRNGDALPAYSEGGASITSDGYVMAGFTTRDGEYHMGAFVGAFSDLENNLKRVVKHCGLKPDQAEALRTTVHQWAGVKASGRDWR